MSESRFIAPRKPWLAGLLSGIQPGLGQLYNGQPTKAILLALFPFLVIAPIVVGLIIYAPLHPPYNVALPVLLAIALLVAIVRDATRVARQQGSRYELKAYNRWYLYISFALLCYFVIQPIGFSLIRQITQAFRIPAGSMAPTLLVGDHVLIDKSISWNGKALQRGEIIVFKFPEDETKEFIKRVVGLPGESIEIRNKTVYVNNTAFDDAMYTQRIDPGILDGRINPRDNFGPVTVPDDSYFVLGDNRDQSLDSRFFGYVRREKIIGKMLLIYWSWDQEGSSVRWDRIGERTW
jgi:signal peptidase I